MLEYKNIKLEKQNHICILTINRPKALNALNSEVLEINSNHKIANKLKELYKDNKEEFEKYTKVIYFEARLIEGLPIDNPTEMSNLMCDIMADK